MRAQISLEYLVLSLVALALISVSVFALLNIRDYADRTSGLFSFRSSALSLASAMSEVCALGSGNVRSVTLGVPLSLEYGEGAVRMTGYNSSVARPSRCEVEPAQELEGLVYVKNDDGAISVKER
jgi:uncharacterized protein (UPF0333 family)